MKLCDLHTHSTFSDGKLTPEQIIDLAVETGLSAVALTDHNTVAGLDNFVSYAEDKPINVVPGTEFSTGHNGRELHILGLFITPDMYDAVNAYLKTAIDRKERSNIDLIKKLNENGYKISYEKIKSSTPEGKFNRANIAEELCRLGYTESINEAMNTVLSVKYGFYTPPERLSSLETIKFISSLGAVAVWAHPLINVSYEECEEFIRKAKDCGLKGIETVYSLYSDEDTAFAKEMCKKHSLLESGGSDFHGSIKPDIFLGKGHGNLKIPYEFYEKLSAEKA